MRSEEHTSELQSHTTIAWWPGRIAPGSVCDAVAGTIDFLPTAVALAGGTVPAQPVIDGRDLSPLLFGKTKESQRDAHYYFAGYNLQAVRQGPWKLAIAAQPQSMGQGTNADASGNTPRLYNLDQEIGEQTNLAAKHPDIVAKLQDLAAKKTGEIGGKEPTARRPAGVVEKPKTLYPTEDASRPKAAKKADKAVAPTAPAKPANLATLKPGDTLDADHAPQVAGKPFTITCAVETAQRDAILLAHGGLTAGYALHLRGGRVALLVRSGADDAFTEIIAPSDFTSGATLTATLAADGVMTLKVGDQPAVTGKATKLLTRQPMEDFCLGHDNGRPVAAYSGKGPFQGSISHLKVTTP